MLSHKGEIEQPSFRPRRKQACSSYFIRDASGVRIKNQLRMQRLVQAAEKELFQKLEGVQSIRVNGPFALAHISFQPFARVGSPLVLLFGVPGKMISQSEGVSLRFQYAHNRT